MTLQSSIGKLETLSNRKYFDQVSTKYKKHPKKSWNEIHKVTEMASLSTVFTQI